jgi:hypothetical protein
MASGQIDRKIWRRAQRGLLDMLSVVFAPRARHNTADANYQLPMLQCTRSDVSSKVKRLRNDGVTLRIHLVSVLRYVQ